MPASNYATSRISALSSSERAGSAAGLHGRDTFHSTYSHILPDQRDSLNGDFETPSSTPPSSTSSLPTTAPPATPPRYKFPETETLTPPTPASLLFGTSQDPPSPSPSPRKKPQQPNVDHPKTRAQPMRRTNTPTTIVLSEEAANMWLAAQVQFSEIPPVPPLPEPTSRASRPLSMRIPGRKSFSKAAAPIKSSSLPLGPMERYERSSGEHSERRKEKGKSWRLSIGRRLSVRKNDGGFCVIA